MFHVPRDSRSMLGSDVQFACEFSFSMQLTSMDQDLFNGFKGQDTRKDSRILLSALVNIIKGQCLIVADRRGGDYSKLLQSTLHQYEIPTDQFWEIEESASVK